MFTRWTAQERIIYGIMLVSFLLNFFREGQDVFTATLNAVVGGGLLGLVIVLAIEFFKLPGRLLRWNSRRKAKVRMNDQALGG